MFFNLTITFSLVPESYVLTHFTRMGPICSTVPSGFVASPKLANKSGIEGTKAEVATMPQLTVLM